jgi:hypothetical protein
MLNLARLEPAPIDRDRTFNLTTIHLLNGCLRMLNVLPGLNGIVPKTMHAIPDSIYLSMSKEF